MSTLSKARRIEVLRGSIEKIVKLLTNKKVVVRQIGTKAYVSWNERTMEPELVVVPVIPDNASDEFLNAIQGFIDHEVAHILYSDFCAVVEARELGVSALHNMVEDCMIESKMAADFAGSDYNLEHMRGIFLSKFVQPNLDKLDEGADTLAYWNVLGICAMRAWSGQKIFKDFMDEGDHWEKIKEVTDVLGNLCDEFKNMASSQDALKLALRIKKKLYGKDKAEDKNDKDGAEGSSSKPSMRDDASEDSSESEGESEDSSESEGESEDSSEGESGELESGDSTEKQDEDAVDGMDDQEESKGDCTDSGRQAEESEETEESEESKESKESEETAESEETEESEETAPLFDEKDDEDLADYDEVLSDELTLMAESSVTSESYTPITRDWDIIKPLNMKNTTGLDRVIEKIDDEVRDMIAPMQREMERMFRAANKSRYHGGYRSGKLNPSALSRMAVEDDRIFRRKVEMKTKEVAVSLVVDCSGSMSGEKMQLAMKSAWALSEVLDRLRINHEIIGFTCIRRDWLLDSYWGERITNTLGEVPEKIMDIFDQVSEIPYGEAKKYSRLCNIYMPVFKSFGENFTNKVKERLAFYYDQRGAMMDNADGESIMYAAQRLLQQKQPGKTMLVLSDGQPAFYYGSDSVRPSVHLRQVVDALKKADFDMIGIGIMSDAVKDYYPKNIVLQDIAKLPTEVMKQLSAIVLQK